MSKSPVNRDGENGIFRLDRREFIMAGLAVAATAMLPRIAFSAPAKQPMVNARRKLGRLEVSALGLGCMVMSGIYGPPRDKQPRDKREMIRLIHAAASDIKVQGARLPQPSLELTRRDAPLKK